MKPSLSALLALSLLVAACERNPPPAPDVVLIVIDTQRAQNLSLYGYERPTSPELERFAREAVTYEHAISPGTWTVPSHASLFTGRWPSFHGAERVAGPGLLARPVREDVPMLAEIFAQRGYATGAFVANSTFVSPPFGFDRGFETFAYQLPNPSAETVTGMATRWLGEQPSPLFLFANFCDPHEPYEPRPPYDSRFPGRSEQLGNMITKYVHSGKTLTPEVVEHFESLYDGETAYADHWVGVLLDTLRRRPNYRDSLVIVTADHGELLGEHGLAGHTIEPYEPELRVPLIVKYPGDRGAGTRVARRVSTLGIFATILESMGIDLPEGTQARPLDESHPVFVEDVNGEGTRIRVAYLGDEKLVRYTPREGAPRSLAFDLARDPQENHPAVGEAPPGELGELLREFGEIPRPEQTAAVPPVDAERERQLRALGYIQ